MRPSSIAKLAAPGAGEILRRPRVLKLIDRSLKTGRSWLAAPAGYGKTTAIVDYLNSTRAPSIWFRVDEGDQDIGRFFHYLAQSLPERQAARLPVFGPEYAEQPEEFAHLYFHAYFAELKPATILVLDDLHDADTPPFRSILAVMLRELTNGVRSICMSRTLPQEEVADLARSRQPALIDRSDLEFSDAEARALVKLRLHQTAVRLDVAPARGWALGLVLLAERGPSLGLPGTDELDGGADAPFAVMAGHFFEALSPAEQELLVQLNLLPEIRTDLADALTGSVEAGRLLRRLYQRQLLITRSGSRGNDFQLHDLLRDFLDQCLTERYSPEEQARLREKAAIVLREAGRFDEAIALALQAAAWGLARQLMLDCAGPMLAEGRRATFIDWCARLPPAEMTAWLSYWLGVAHLPDDAAAERWLSRAWASFEESGDRRGQCLAISRTVLVKATSWRTYEGFSAWTRRATTILQAGLPELADDEDLLVRSGMVRALDFADEYYREGPVGQALVSELLQRLSERPAGDPSGLRLPASESLIEHAISTGQADLFAKAVDSVAEDLRDPALSPWVLGNWLVVFGCASGRYFRYSRRGFPYAGAEEALRAAIAIGERESFRNVEFGGLYQLQMLMKLRNDFAEFGELITRLAEIADSRFTTQVAVVADCQAALHARQGNFVEAYRDCDRFMAAIEAANEPIIERWPHYITKFQVFLADRKPEEATALLADLLPRLDSGALARTKLCLLVAAALRAKWSGDPGYTDRLRTFLTELASVRWPAILLNLPALLAELLADALDRGVAAEHCRSVIRERRLTPPPQQSASWPWPLRVHLLGGFRLDRDEAPVALGAKPPTRALDILRALAVSRDGACSLDTLQDRLWPDLDGDQAKAACEQALHRLRKLLGDADLIVQREGRLRLDADKVFVDLSAWEGRLRPALAADDGEAATAERERLFFDFPGPLLLNERLASWLLPVTERVRRALVDLAIRVGKERERRGEVSEALAIYLRALDFYPDAGRLHKSLIEARLEQNDVTGAIEDFARYERTMRAADAEPSPAIVALVKPLRATGRLDRDA